MDRMRRVVTVPLVLAAIALPLTPGSAAQGTPTGGTSLPLPAPQRSIDPLAGIGLTRDRLLTSVTPGTVDNREAVTVQVGPAGAPQQVLDQQQLDLRGTGNYVIRERGPARDATAVGGTVPPVLELGTVVWQGFSPGHRSLAARLTLDAGLEAQRLPLAVRMEFTTAAGRTSRLRPGLVAPADGTLRVTLVNRTGTVMTEPVGVAALHPLVTSLETLRRAARHAGAGPPPTVGHGLPTAVPGRLQGRTSATVNAPLRIRGTVAVTGGRAQVTGAGVTTTPTGARIAGILDGETTLTAELRGGQRVNLDLSAQPSLDPRLLAPPDAASNWQGWARRHPTTVARQRATATLVAEAAMAARAAEYTPYLQADVPGRDRTTFRYVSAPRPAPLRRVSPLRPHPVAIVAVCVAAVAIVGNLLLLRRRL